MGYNRGLRVGKIARLLDLLPFVCSSDFSVGVLDFRFFSWMGSWRSAGLVWLGSEGPSSLIRLVEPESLLDSDRDESISSKCEP